MFANFSINSVKIVTFPLQVLFQKIIKSLLEPTNYKFLGYLVNSNTLNVTTACVSSEQLA